jgi:hypothetical protein
MLSFIRFIDVEEGIIDGKVGEGERGGLELIELPEEGPPDGGRPKELPEAEFEALILGCELECIFSDFSENK